MSESNSVSPDVLLIQTQTGIDDLEIIKRSLADHDGDVISTIMHLNKLTECPTRDVLAQEVRSDHDRHMDMVRAIVDEKERMFYEWKEGGTAPTVQPSEESI